MNEIQIKEYIEFNNVKEILSNSFKSMLKPEQAKSLDLIMKMAQLLAQDSTEKESAD